MTHMAMIPGAKIISAKNYEQSHGCQNFQAYAAALRLQYLERKSSGIYVVGGLIRDVVKLADFGGFNVVKLQEARLDGSLPVWVVQRAPDCVVVENVC